jgi:hypothetical protein
LGDFLVHLFEVEKLKPKTIANYRSSLSSTLAKVDGFCVQDHPYLTMLIKSFMLADPPRRNLVPEWDLSVVLAKLRSAPFEPLSWSDAKSRLRTTIKTVFLLALASARRRGELQAISRDSQDFVVSRSGVHLRTVVGFLPKTAVMIHDPKPFFIPRLTPFSGRDNDDRLLCPVRALIFYLHATGGCKPGERLFQKVSGAGAVTAQTVSSWIVRCIRDCCGENIKAKAHEVRRSAASWAYQSSQHHLEDILCAGSWASHTTFSSYYLADVRAQSDGRLRLHPVIAGKQTDCL